MSEDHDSTRRSLLAAGLLGGVGIIAAPVQASANALVAANQDFFVGAQEASNVLFSGAVIRFSDPNGWPSIHANPAHMAAGVLRVDVNQYGEVRVWQTIRDPHAYPVIFAFAQADETLGGMRGIMVGASGGTDNTRFRLYDTRLGRSLDLNNRSDRMRCQGKNSNMWVGWVHAKGWG